jgi:hypothetical protein
MKKSTQIIAGILFILLILGISYLDIRREKAEENPYYPYPYTPELTIMWNDDYESIPKTGDIIQVQVDWEDEYTVIFTKIK